MAERITVFTPTYNRKKTLLRLYKSLCNQNSKLFQWLIVDDGSTDGTEKIVANWIDENIITIKYFKQNNAGKSMAHNRGVEKTDTELFVCVDSDDSLVPEAIDTIIKTWEQIREKNYIGIIAYRGTYKGENISSCQIKVEASTLKDAYQKYGFKGDSMLVYKTEVLKKYQFPYFEGEKFVPEAYLYDQLDQEGELYFIHKILYLGEYLKDGYTNNMRKLIKNNPMGYIAYINQRIELENSFLNTCKDCVRYIAVKKCLTNNNIEIIYDAKKRFVTAILLPIGTFFYYKLYRKIEE